MFRVGFSSSLMVRTSLMALALLGLTACESENQESSETKIEVVRTPKGQPNVIQTSHGTYKTMNYTQQVTSIDGEAFPEQSVAVGTFESITGEVFDLCPLSDPDMEVIDQSKQASGVTTAQYYPAEGDADAAKQCVVHIYNFN